MILGSHLSIVGGAHRAVERAAAHGFQTVGLFVRNQRQWRAAPLGEAAVTAFRRARRRLGIAPVVAHGSYLVNLAGREPVRRRGLAATRDELDRCGRLGIEYLVIHPGSHPDPAAGVARIAEALNAAVGACAHRRPTVLLETTAGAGHTLGWRFEQLAAMLARLRPPGRFGVCLDTCHVFAAGYDLRSPRAYRRTMDAFDDLVGLRRLRAVHLNDSVHELGSRRDRHAHIGHGRIGRRGLARLVNDPRLAEVPMILETPKQAHPHGRSWDEVNAEVIRGLLRRPARRAAIAPPARRSAK
jgi:deoxyribonuclease-4